MEACDEQLQHLPAPEKQEGYAAVCMQFNIVQLYPHYTYIYIYVIYVPFYPYKIAITITFYPYKIAITSHDLQLYPVTVLALNTYNLLTYFI